MTMQKQPAPKTANSKSNKAHYFWKLTVVHFASTVEKTVTPVNFGRMSSRVEMEQDMASLPGGKMVFSSNGYIDIFGIYM